MQEIERRISTQAEHLRTVCKMHYTFVSFTGCFCKFSVLNCVLVMVAAK